jgi:hypothetical protein
LGQWFGGQSTPWGYARNPASAGKIGYCVGDAERRLVLDAGRRRSLSNSASILIARVPLHSWRTVKGDVKFEAVLRIARELPRWQWTWVIHFIPRVICDPIYDLVA